jgi:hypothetical protein
MNLSKGDMEELRKCCRSYAAYGHLELFKTSVMYDGKVG